MCMWEYEEEENINPLEFYQLTLIQRINKYIYIAESFDETTIFAIELNAKFGHLLYLENIIKKSSPKTSDEKIMYKKFLKCRRHIDLLINPDKFKTKPAVVVEYKRTPFQIKPINTALYKVNDDKNKKKYKSILIITRSDTTGIEIKKIQEEVSEAPEVSEETSK